MDVSSLSSSYLFHKVMHAGQYWLSKPFQVFLAAEERVFWPYLITGFIVAMITMCFLQRKPLVAALKELFDPAIVTHEDNIYDLQYFFVNNILFWLVLIPLTAWMMGLFTIYGSNAVQSLGLTGVLGPTNNWILAVFTLLTLAVNDLGIYITHRLQHQVPLLWHFHKTHHSAEVLTPMTEYRIHPVDFLLGFVISFIMVGFFNGAFQSLFIGHMAEVKVWGVNIIQMVYYSTFFNLRHSHVWVYFGRFWSKIVISPAQHHIHHSVDTKHYDKNFGQLFGLWDWMFGTMYYPENGYEKIVVGLGDPVEQKYYKSLLGLYFSPFLGIWRQWGPKRLGGGQANPANNLVPEA